MAIVYGRLTDYELDKQGDSPYIEAGGRRYRITELVHLHGGGANYQAKEVTESDPEPPEPVLPEPTIVVAVGGGVAVEHGAPRPKVDEGPKVFAPIVPPLSAWAKRHGWAGVGRIPKVLIAKYNAEFGTQE